jgi:DNA-binding transcriptional regulator YhcF (GntR family)
MSRGRAKVENKYYMEIDKDAYENDGEIKLIGTPINVAEQIQKVPRGGFEIAYMTALFDIFDKLGNQKMQVLKYLLKHKDGMNTLNISQRELAKEAGCSLPTVNATLKLLKEAGLLVQKGSVLRISARVTVKGSVQKEGYIMRKFTEELEEQTPTDNSRDNIITMRTGTDK